MPPPPFFQEFQDPPLGSVNQLPETLTTGSVAWEGKTTCHSVILSQHLNLICIHNYELLITYYRIECQDWELLVTHMIGGWIETSFKGLQAEGYIWLLLIYHNLYKHIDPGLLMKFDLMIYRGQTLQVQRSTDAIHETLYSMGPDNDNICKKNHH